MLIASEMTSQLDFNIALYSCLEKGAPGARSKANISSSNENIIMYL